MYYLLKWIKFSVKKDNIKKNTGKTILEKSGNFVSLEKWIPLINNKRSVKFLTSVFPQLIFNFRCDDCGKEYKDELALNAHKKIHMADHLYACNVCYKSKWKLLHIRIYT